MPPKTIIAVLKTSRRGKRTPSKVRNPRGKSSRPARTDALSLFLRSAMNPFMFAPPALGYEMFASPTLDTLWQRVIGKSTATGTFLALHDPSSCVSYTTNVLSTTPSSYLAVDAPSPSTIIDANLFSTYGPINQATFASRTEQFRPITSALRVTVRYPMTTAPGRLFGLCITSSNVAIGALTLENLIALDASRPIAFDGSGVVTMQVNWRQRTILDFTLGSPAAGVVPAAVVSKCMIIGTGWPVGTLVDYEVVTHVESLAGSKAGGEEGDDVPSLALSVPLEVLATKIRPLPIVLDKMALQACQASQLVQSIRRHVISGAGSSSSSSSSSSMGPTLHSVPESVVANDYVEVSSTGAGDFVAGAGQAIYDRMPSASSAGYTIGGLALTGALGLAQRHQHNARLGA